ncbi:uncharacterized protein (TIGR01777 family) [Microbacteriaceae bacterium SG_E_30_P1]|uniref:Uncharacterized protein (TIGR01777 family) n=1 Tax=Antiquaquibacter oligotrophicus TaxID=2880260 RepID=A0ABT6KNG5_9MICO|nr:TIGR01777 family oxidoreductase [Antiquaquibacter oligotrophicus]MDH6180677.1 uncharacterized protein (TIGR01777 family) [Antiquaquibacter oligotrophicus]UDF13596.1 TIGR01777 family oxidoreductase [Antiquaquibacter oligotrophicus]
MAPSGRTVLVSGASGFIGSELCRQLESQGNTVLRLVRRAPRTPGEFAWAPADGVIDQSAVERADAVVNLSGASTGRQPWTHGYKAEILRSRVLATQTIVDAILRADSPPTVLVNGSAVGFYGDRGEESLTEASPKGSGFLSDVVSAWEEAAKPASERTRVVLARTGVVVGHGGAFTPLLALTRVGLGARFGSGKQFWPWIGLHDEAAAIRHLLDSTMDGAVNLAGPVPATSREITEQLARTLGRWHPFAVPTFALSALGDAGRDLLLASQRVAPTRLEQDGFVFRDRTHKDAIERAFGAARAR